MRKRLIYMIVMAVVLFILPGCHASNDIFTDRQPASMSALILSRYDGQDTIIRYVYEEKKINEIFEALSKVKVIAVADWIPTYTSGNIYGISTTDSQGFLKEFVLVDDHLMAASGETYEFKFDFEKWWNDTDTTHDTELPGKCAVPCLSRMTKGMVGFSTRLMNRAPERVPDEGVTMTISTIEGTDITVCFENNSNQEWAYGYYYSIDVLLDGIWYEVPAEKEICFPDLALLVENGGSRFETYSLEPYGSLPNGEYRIAVGIGDPNRGHSAEFFIENGKAFVR